MSRFLITGGAGFIGSHLARHLHRRDHRVVIVDDLSTGSFDNLEDEPYEDFLPQDVIQLPSRVLESCDIIIHLAASVGVRNIIENPLESLRNNVETTQWICDKAQEYRKKILVASTSEVYGKSPEHLFKEDGDLVLGPTSSSRWSYACGKLVDEFIALNIRTPSVVCRFFNTIGPKQSGLYGMVVPRFIRAALNGEPIRVYGNGKQRRCFCDVSDVVRAIMDLAFCSQANKAVVNIGSQKEISIIGLAKLVKSLTNSDSPIVKVPYEEVYGPNFEDMRRRMPSLKRAKNLINFAPNVSLKETIQRIINEDYARNS